MRSWKESKMNISKFLPFLAGKVLEEIHSLNG
jgi:hypothetical protein